MEPEVDNGRLSASVEGEVCVTINIVAGSFTQCVDLAGVGVNSDREIRVSSPLIGDPHHRRLVADRSPTVSDSASRARSRPHRDAL